MKTNKNYFFSIIVPSRKLNRYLLNETLPALEKQTYKQFEVIVLPNNDRGFEMLKKKYSWLKIIKNSSMPGIKRDLGVKKAKGDIVVFIDDDAYPPSSWLNILNRIYQAKNDVVSVGGPGILPKNVNLWEKIFDIVMQSFLGTGGFSYRFIKGKKQYVDDFPSMNLSFRKNDFLKLGGFNNKYWPGEDSKLINALINKEKKHIYYDPQTYIYHHRRNTLTGYLKQHRNYGFMRGMFFADGDKNSQSIAYKIPSLFTVYTFLLLVMYTASRITPVAESLLKIITVPLFVYGIMIFFILSMTFVRSLNILLALGVMIVLPLTHIVYGISFIKGYMNSRTS